MSLGFFKKIKLRKNHFIKLHHLLMIMLLIKLKIIQFLPLKILLIIYIKITKSDCQQLQFIQFIKKTT
jgi:hypothetical protein